MALDVEPKGAEPRLGFNQVRLVMKTSSGGADQQPFTLINPTCLNQDWDYLGLKITFKIIFLFLLEEKG